MKIQNSPFSLFRMLRYFGLFIIAAGTLSGTVTSAHAVLLADYAGANIVTSTGLVVPRNWADNVKEPAYFTPSAGLTVSGTTGVSSVYYSGWDSTINLEKYVSFQVEAEDGYALTLTDFSFRTRSETGGVNSFAWGYRVDEGAGFGTWTFGLTYTSASPDFLGSIAKAWNFDDFTTTGTVEFGLFATGASGAARAEWRTATLNGSVAAVPEPSTYGMMIAAGLAALVIARRRKAVVNV